MRTTGRFLLIAGLAGLSGCADGPITGRTSAMGSLKASVSQLEFQNDELQRQVSSLKAENRKFEDRLVQERAENERLQARLGDGPEDVRTGSRSGSVGDDEEIPPPRARRSKSTRKPPAAAIPGHIEPARPSDEDDLGAADPPPSRSRLASRRSYDDRWLPVARGTGSGQAVK